jgi:hypothetical protein
MGEEKIGMAQGMESGGFCQRVRRKFTGKSLYESYLTWCGDVFIQASVYTGANLSVKKWAAPLEACGPSRRRIQRQPAWEGGSAVVPYMFKYAEFGCDFCEIHHKIEGKWC